MPVKEAQFVYGPDVKLGIFDFATLQKAGETKLIAEIHALWNRSTEVIAAHNLKRVAELDKIISDKNDECRKLSDRLAAAQERSGNAKFESLNADANVDTTYRTIGAVKAVALPKYPTSSEVDTKIESIKIAERQHQLALETAKRAESEFMKHGQQMLDAARRFSSAANELEDYQDEYFKLASRRHPLDTRSDKDIKRNTGLAIR